MKTPIGAEAVTGSEWEVLHGAQMSSQNLLSGEEKADNIRQKKNSKDIQGKGMAKDSREQWRGCS